MMRILLLDCFDSLANKLKARGFDVESGTVGFSTGFRQLPSQVYEKDIFIYNPTSVFTEENIDDVSREYNLGDLERRITSGAIFLAFINPLSNDSRKENACLRMDPLYATACLHQGQSCRTH